MQTEIPLFAHQEAAAAFIIGRRGSGCLFHEMGTGKTRTALEIFKRSLLYNPEIRALVIAPVSLLEAAWGEDNDRFAGLPFLNLRKKGIPADVSAGTLCVLNYESLIQKKTLAAVKSMLIKQGPWLCFVDESSRLKNNRSITTETILSLRSLLAGRVVLSGTPAPNSETEYWGQLEFVSPNIFGSSFSKFKNSYFHLEDRDGKPIFTNGMTMTRTMMQELYKKRGARYAINEANQRLLAERIAPVCHYAKKEECLDLPEEMDESRQVELGVKQRRIYTQMLRLLVAEINSKTVAAPFAITKLMKLREIISGFCAQEDGTILDIGENPKLEELLSVLEELGPRQVIIWGQFTWEIEKILSALKERGHVVARLDGKVTNREKEIDLFKSGEARYLVAHPRAAAHGLTFVNADTEIFFSLDYSLETYAQARARIHRAGQTKPCTYVHLLASNTIDEDILEALRKKSGEAMLVEAMIRRAIRSRSERNDQA